MTKRRKLPKRIELIDEKRGHVLEFELSHAERILKLQDTTGLGKLKIYNTQLYYFDHEQWAICHNEREHADTNSLPDNLTGAE